MNTIGRLVLRDGLGTQAHLVLGVIFKSAAEVLDTSQVYEIRECFGEIMIQPVGKTAIGHTGKDSALNTCWGHDINFILSCNTSGEHLWTEAEYQAVLAKEQEV